MSLPTVYLSSALRRPLGVPGPAEVVTVSLGDKTFEAGRRTAAHLQATVLQLAVEFPAAHLHVMQQCFHTGYEPSAGTHDGDGVLDIKIEGLDGSLAQWWAAQAFMRRMGWASWFRHTDEWAAPSAWHLHSVSLGCPGKVGYYVPGQVDDYNDHALGLKGEHDSGDDPTWHPPDIEATYFDYPAWLIDQEDKMPWSDWPLDDRKMAAQDIAAAVWGFAIGSAKLSASKMLNRIYAAVVPAAIKRKDGVSE